MIKLPKTLKLGAYVYKVLFPYNFKERSDVAGQHCSVLKEIRIQLEDGNGLERVDEDILRLFFHELCHAIDEIYCMGNIGKEVDKEPLVNAIAEGLTQWFVDNELPEMKEKV